MTAPLLQRTLSLLLLSSTLAPLQASERPDPALLSDLAPRAIGPAGMSGRVAAICAVASDPRTIYVGAATGGLWKSTDLGVTWTPLFDDQPVASIGAVEIFQPSPEIVWVGTGEGNPRNSASVGKGVFRSLDGGRSWTHLGLEHSEKIARIVLHPSDPDIAWVAALGTTWGENPERGVFRTRDGGRTWDRVLFVDERTGCADLARDPSNPRKLLAAMWDHRRRPDFFRSGGPGSGLLLSRDGGDTWRRLGPAEGLPEGELGRIGIAFAPSEPSVVYALVEAERSALLRSEDGGATWRTVNDDRGIANRPFYYADLRVDPADPNRVYNLASVVTVSTDGGRTFETLTPWSAVHPDHHAMWIHPQNPHLVLDGNDGGVSISYSRGRTWRFVANLPLAQYYHVAVDLDVPYHVYGGMQDNGSWRGPSDVWENGGIRNLHWVEVGFGDGFATLPIPGDSTRGYAMSQGGALMRWDLSTGERKGIRPPAPDGVELRFNWNAGIAIDPFDRNTVYYGSQFVHRSRDRGDTWEVISPDLTSNNPEWQRQAESGGLTPDVTGAENYTTIVTIAPSPLQPGVIWVGTDDGRLQLTRDGGESWIRVDENVIGVPPDTWIPHVEASKHDPAVAYVVFDDHRRANWTPYVYRTRDWGKSWTSLATAELDGYCHVIEEDPVDPRVLYLGSEFGLFVSLDGGRHWMKWTHGFPTVAVRDLVVHPREHDLVIGTHGRAAWILDDIRPLRVLADGVPEEALTILSVPPANQHAIAQSPASRFPGDGEFRGATRPYGALITFWANGEDLPDPEAGADRGHRSAGSPGGRRGAEARRKRGGERKGAEGRRVKVEILDEGGEVIRTFRRDVHRGLNRIVWNLRRKGFRSLREPRRGEEPAGPEVIPGSYTVRLSLGEASAEAPLEVRPDPRVPFSLEVRLALWEAQQRAGRLSETLVEAVRRLERTRQDVETILALAQRASEDAGAREDEDQGRSPAEGEAAATPPVAVSGPEGGGEQPASESQALAREPGPETAPGEEVAGQAQPPAQESPGSEGAAGAPSGAVEAEGEEAEGGQAGERGPYAELIERGRKLKKAIDELLIDLRGDPEAKGIPARDDVAEELGNAYWALASSWDAPSPSQLAALERAESKLSTALGRLDELFADEVASFRDGFRASGLELLPELEPIQRP